MQEMEENKTDLDEFGKPFPHKLPVQSGPTGNDISEMFDKMKISVVGKTEKDNDGSDDEAGHESDDNESDINLNKSQFVNGEPISQKH